MSANNLYKMTSLALAVLLGSFFSPLNAIAKTISNTSAKKNIAEELGWQPRNNYCGGEFIDIPRLTTNKNEVDIYSKESVFSAQGTSILKGNVTVSHKQQYMHADQALLFRNATTGKLQAINLTGRVEFREPATLIKADSGEYFFKTTSRSLTHILYRTQLSTREHAHANSVATQAIAKSASSPNPLTVWGKAAAFTQHQPLIYELTDTSYSSCPPDNSSWHVQAKKIVLNKITGRGYATHAVLYIKNMPIFYLPYINFSIDKQRKTGFLWPSFGQSNKWGTYLTAPFYWNIAPNLDMTISPSIYGRRGFNLENHFRYLTKSSEGEILLSILPKDQAFHDFQRKSRSDPNYTANPVVQAELNRLESSVTTRKAFIWRNQSRFNDNWSGHVDFNYAGDDYYLQDFGRNLTDVTNNQLLQEADLFYQAEHWQFIGKIQAYQTLHPINETPTLNQYRRFPELILNGDYPDQWLGLEYFVNNDITHFEIRKNPGSDINYPVGNRFHTQPGISLPLDWSFFSITPRLQLAMTQYELYNINPTGAPASKRRVLPIFDVASQFSLTRGFELFNHGFTQTLEPQAYYTFIPYRSQNTIPLFDTTINTLTYDQIFNYNRFTGIDRIGDANQVALGVTSRFINDQTGLEKIRLGVGEIFYFSRRKVTLCDDTSCTDNPNNHANDQKVSPISAVFDYHLSEVWQVSTNAIWNPISRKMNNTTVGLHYQTNENHIINLDYGYARGSDPLSGVVSTDPHNNLKVTSVSMAWPISHQVTGVGLWSQNWNHAHLQNLLYGIQYDTCCWAVRFVGGRRFTGFDPNNNNKPQFSSEYYVQFSLKGLGDVSTGNPASLLNNIMGYNSQFGQG